MQAGRNIVDGDMKPGLPKHVRLQFEPLRNRWAVLAPERVFWPDDASLSILRRCDGATRTDDIIGALCSEYDAPKDTVRDDVFGFLQEWSDKRLITWGK